MGGDRDAATPTARKLGINAGSLVVLVDAPVGWSVPDLPPGVDTVAVSRRADAGVATTGRSGETRPVVIAFFRTAAEVPGRLDDLLPAIVEGTALWTAWPRRAGGHVSDITDNTLRDAALARGLVDNKVAAIDPDWSGLRFVRRKGPLRR